MVIKGLFHLYTSIINILVINYFFSRATPQKINQLISILTLGVLVIIEVLANCFLRTNLASLITVICSFLTSFYIASIYDYGRKQGLFWAILLQTIGLLFEAILGFSLTLFFGDALINSATFTFIYINLLAILSIIMSFYLKHFFLFELSDTDNHHKQGAWIICLSLIPAITCALLFFQLFDSSTHYELDASTLIYSFGFMAITIISLYTYRYMMIQNTNHYNTKLDNIRFQAQLHNMQNLKDSHLKIRALKHDLHNHHIVLIGLLKQEKFDEAEQLINNNLAQLTETNDTFFTNELILNHLLNQKSQTAKENNICLSISCLIPSSTRLKTDIIAIIVGNLLDNSISAVIRNKRTTEKKINLIINLYNEKLYIAIENGFDPQEAHSRKQRLYDGLGLRNIKDIVNRYHGLYKQEINENIYKITILFPHVDSITNK
ncbi:GHKL domain-containing protein [Streptococcus thoraltensis]|uniref:GHKL domain-containing protein n=1 Tax=Streptococcus thoraltensis TaxID=55085 RepID=UPI002A824D63|nr:GHKL domain-containing protein [Streptococcus thoraltensis]MDY4762411.1 GHKL domain-containing protein [Streptococcus thoraltensis]